MIIGSIDAIRENSIRRMIAYSSVAQIGYIYMGFGLGTELWRAGERLSYYLPCGDESASVSLGFLSDGGIRGQHEFL